LVEETLWPYTLQDMNDTESTALLKRLIQSPANPCFVCGPTNPHGLHVHFEQVDGGIEGRFTPGPWQQGWQGVIHGGILAALLDEAMAYTLFMTGSMAVTVRMELRYRRAARAGDDLQVNASIVRDSSRLVDVEGRILRGSVVLVEAAGRFMKLGPIAPGAVLDPTRDAAP